MTDDNKNNHINTELTPEERRRFNGLPREIPPPPDLERRIVQRLRYSGLVAQRPRWWVGASALVASVLIFIMGYTLGARTVPETVAPLPDRQYVLFLYESSEFELSPADDPGQLTREYMRWAAEIDETGNLAGGERLADDGWVLARSEDGVGVDQRLLDAPEGVIAGYFVIYAEDDEDALAIALTHPHLRRGGRIALRAVDPIS